MLEVCQSGCLCSWVRALICFHTFPLYPHRTKKAKNLSCVCAQLHPILCNSMDYSLQNSSVNGMFQAGILEQVAIS